jgi:hypothetical protein
MLKLRWQTNMTLSEEQKKMILSFICSSANKSKLVKEVIKKE